MDEELDVPEQAIGEGEENQQQKEVEEPDIPQDDFYPPEDVLIRKVQETIQNGLQKIGKIHDGSSYSFAELVCENKGLKLLYNVMEPYQYLRVIKFTNNQLEDVSSLTQIPHLTLLDLRANQIKDLNSFNIEGTLKYLEVLNLTSNQIKSLDPILLPRLKKLILSYNQVESCEAFSGHQSLEILELKKNKLTKLKGLENMPNLHELYLAENLLTEFSDLKDLPQLLILRLRKNQIVELSNIPLLPRLHHLNLRENQLARLDSLKQLLSLPRLRSLTAHQNPFSDEIGDSVKKETIMILQEIQRVNKEEVTADDRTDALNELKERKIEAERKQKEEEEEQARLLEEAQLAEEARKAELAQNGEQIVEDA